jgi:hypothetical protein
MSIIFNILIFCLVLFIYIHVYFHLKKSDDLEVYEIDQPSKLKLEEICDIRQPVVFNFYNERIIDSCQRKTVLDTYGAFDVKIRNIKDTTDISELYIPLAFSSALKVLSDDTTESYISENNNEFLEETGMVKVFTYNDDFLRPPMVSSYTYDYICASNKCKTPFRYEVNYRNYFLVTEGEVKVKMAPPRSSRYLNVIKDYENFEFRSPINPWKVQEKYKPDFDKIKCLEVTLVKGQIIFIPAYWWYSFNLTGSMCSFKYRTYMNTVSIMPQLVMRFLQRQNVKRNTIGVKEKKDDLVMPVIDNTTIIDNPIINNNLLPTNIDTILPYDIGIANVANVENVSNVDGTTNIIDL